MSKPLHVSVVVLLAVYTIVWGVWLVLPFWDVFSQAQLYSEMANVAPEISWGSTAIISGGITMLGLVRNNYWYERLGVGLTTWHWFMVAIFYFLGDWANTGGITAMFLVCYSAYIFLKLKLTKDLGPAKD